jgi:hypothetical protein
VDPRAGLDDVKKILDSTATRTATPRSSSLVPGVIPTTLSRLLQEVNSASKCRYTYKQAVRSYIEETAISPKSQQKEPDVPQITVVFRHPRPNKTLE